MYSVQHYVIVCQWLATDQWISPDIPVSSTNKTDHHDIAEIMLKVVLNTINQPSQTSHLHSLNTKKDHSIWRWKSRFLLDLADWYCHLVTDTGNIGQCDVTLWRLKLIKTLRSVFKVSTYNITIIAALPIVLTMILQWNLFNPTHQWTRKMCGIVQDVGILRFYFS